MTVHVSDDLMVPFSPPRFLLPSFVALALTVVSATARDVVHYQRLISFGSVTNDGIGPWAALVQGRDGALYGTTHEGGSNNVGTVFKLNLDGSGYENLHHFADRAGDGVGPLAGLQAASDGFLYGTTSGGGNKGDGTVFKLQPDGGGYTVVYSFTFTREGNESQAAVIEGSDGLLYGTTTYGPGSSFAGSLFAMNKDGTGLRLLHRFGPYSSNDGLQPLASVLEASDGALYGTTSIGGGSGVGSVFKINKDGTGYLKLHAFGPDGLLNPFASLLEGSDHALYGTTGGGGGSVFKLNKDGTGFQVLHGFFDDWSFAALIKGRDGALYSTTAKGGGAGNVFRLNEDGTGFEVLHRFGSSPDDGIYPEAPLVLASDGAFYGGTLGGGDFGRGAIFRLLVNRVPVPQCTDVILAADTNCLANASVDKGSFDPDGDPITLVQSPPGPYPVGTNHVTLTVTDSNGDSDSCTASVIVLDTMPPQISCPSNIVVNFTEDAGAVVTYALHAADTCDPNPVVTSVPASGTLFPFGTTEVDSTATDASGNQASCSFTVTVLGARSVKQDVLAQLIALRGTLPCDHGRHGGKGANEEVCQKLDDAIAHLRAALNSAWWIDDTHLQSGNGQFVFEEEHATAVQLCFLLDHRPDALPGALLEGFLGQLNRADHLLAAVAIQEAFHTGAAPRTIDQAQTFLAKGDAAAALDLCRVAIPAYRQAWSIAVRAKPSPPIHPPNGHIQVALPAKSGAPAHRSGLY